MRTSSVHRCCRRRNRRQSNWPCYGLGRISSCKRRIHERSYDPLEVLSVLGLSLLLMSRKKTRFSSVSVQVVDVIDRVATFSTTPGILLVACTYEKVSQERRNRT